MNIRFPNYDNCLTNVTNSILKYFDIKPYHTTLDELDKVLEKKNYKNILLLLYDGMGTKLLERNLKSTDFLRINMKKNIDAVFPPTTTASTTSVLSGLNPCEHGWLGWNLYFKEIDGVVTMFLNTKKDTDEKVAEEDISKKYYSYSSIIDLINEKYKAYQLMPFGDGAYHDLNEMNKRIIELSKKEGKKFIYAYCDEPDHTMHEVGTDSNETIDLFQKINKSTQLLCDSLENTLVIVVADHGHLNCEGITLSEYSDIFNLLSKDISVESRACSFFIKDGKQNEFESLFRKYFGNEFYLYSKKDVLEKKIFGIGNEHKRFQDSLGNYIAIAIGNKYFRYNENSVDLLSMHAGITEDEVMIPLIIFDSDDSKKNYKLIAMDFDETLLNDEKMVTQRTKDALTECRKAGYIIVGVTARTLKSAEDVVSLELFDYLILNNGAYLYDVKKQVGTYVSSISDDEVINVINLVDDVSSQIDLISGTIYYIYKNRKNSPLNFIRDIDNINEMNEPVARMNIFLNDENEIDYYNELINKKCQNANCFIMKSSNSDKRWLVVNPKGIDKSTTLEKLGKDLNILLDEIMFFGDGLNDLEVMESVGYSVAMGNALDEIKSRANEITLSNNEDGIAVCLEKRLIKK